MKRKHYFYDFYNMRLKSPIVVILLFILVVPLFTIVSYHIGMSKLPYDNIDANYAEIQEQYDAIYETVEKIKTTKDMNFIITNMDSNCYITIDDTDINIRFTILNLPEDLRYYDVKLDKQYNVMSEDEFITKEMYIKSYESSKKILYIYVGFCAGMMVGGLISFIVNIAAGISKKKRDEAYYYN